MLWSDKDKKKKELLKELKRYQYELGDTLDMLDLDYLEKHGSIGEIKQAIRIAEDSIEYLLEYDEF